MKAGPIPGLLLAAIGLLGCGETAPSLNVVLVSVDTLRWDRVGLYGAERETTPDVDAFFSEGTVFENATASAPCTLPSVPQYLSGSFVVSDDRPTLAERLGEAGYATHAIVSQHQFHPERFDASRSGLDPDDPGREGEGAARETKSRLSASVSRGFEIFDIQGEDERDHHGFSTRTADEITDRALAFLESHSEDAAPFFLWLHYFDPHDPYEPPAEHRVWGSDNPSERTGDRRRDLQRERREGDRWSRAGYIYSRDDVSHLRDLYDAEVRFVDEELGRFFDGLSDRGPADTTFVVLIADHGEWLGRDDRWDHCQTLRDEEIRVPLLLRDPHSRKPRRTGGDAGPVRVQDAVSTLDIVPTVLARLGLGHDPTALDGADLARRDEGRITFASWRRERMARNSDWKLVADRRPRSLHRVGKDSYEEVNVLDERPPGLRELRTALERFTGREEPEAQNDRVTERLRALGYTD